MPILIVAGSQEQLKQGKGESMLTITQAAARLGVGERTLRIYVGKGRITPYDERLMGCLLFSEPSVEELKESMMKDGY